MMSPEDPPGKKARPQRRPVGAFFRSGSSNDLRRSASLARTKKSYAHACKFRCDFLLRRISCRISVTSVRRPLQGASKLRVAQDSAGLASLPHATELERRLGAHASRRWPWPHAQGGCPRLRTKNMISPKDNATMSTHLLPPQFLATALSAKNHSVICV